MSDISSHGVGRAANPAAISPRSEEQPNDLRGVLRGRSAYDDSNTTPRVSTDLNVVRSLLRTPREQIASLHGREAKSLPSDSVEPSRIASRMRANGKGLARTAPAGVGSNASATRLIGERNAKNVGGATSRFAGLKNLGRAIGQKISSLFKNVRSDSGKARERLRSLPDSLRNVIKQHEKGQEIRHANMRAQLKNRGKFDLRTRKFANLFAERTAHFDRIAPKFTKGTQEMYKAIKKETEGLLKQSEGKVFTTDKNFQGMISRLENLNNLFMQELDMELLELKLERK